MSSPPGPRAGGPRPRRVFTPAQKLAYLTAYDQARADGSGGGDYLRREGLYSSQITQWRQLRDGGALTAAAAAGTKIPKLTSEQAENARLKRQLDNRCGTRLRWTGDRLCSSGSCNPGTAIDLCERKYGVQHHGDH